MAKNDARSESTAAASSEGGAALSPLDRRRQQMAFARDLRGLDFDAGLQAAAAQGQVVSAAQAGLGYKLIENRDDKDHLVGVELYVLPGWTVSPSEKIPGRSFTSCYVKTRHPVPQLEGATEFILNDGSTGIAQQLADLREHCIAVGEDDPTVYCRRGLKKSEYEVTDVKLDDLGQPVIDRRTNRPVRVPRVDPVTKQPIGRGATYYLDTAS